MRQGYLHAARDYPDTGRTSLANCAARATSRTPTLEWRLWRPARDWGGRHRPGSAQGRRRYQQLLTKRNRALMSQRCWRRLGTGAGHESGKPPRLRLLLTRYTGPVFLPGMTLQFECAGPFPLLMHSDGASNSLSRVAQRLSEVSGKRRKTEADIVELARREFHCSLYLDPAGLPTNGGLFGRFVSRAAESG